MSLCVRPLGCMVAVALSLWLPAIAIAELVRFRYVPAGADGSMKQVPIGPDGAIGELRAIVGGTPKPYQATFAANRMVTFRHPYTSCNVTIPMKLPESTPAVEHIGDRIRFNYGSYYVETRFLPDGGADVVYNSGFLRPLPP